MILIKSLEKYLKYNDEKVKKEWLKKSKGERALINDYIHTRTDERMLKDYLVIEDVLWESELEEYLKAMKKYGITKIVYADKSTACFRTIMFFLQKECKISTIPYKKDYACFGESEEILEGMLIEI